VRRPFHVLATAGTAAHHGFELASGVGLVFQPQLGLPGALALWATALPGLATASARGSSRWDPPLAFANGAGLAGAAVHFTLWPWAVRAGVPMLTEAEGLSPAQLPAYNAVLWAWALAAVAALVTETPPRARRWFALGMLSGVPLRLSARHHFSWAREQARVNPAWWNRGLR
jgi:hypothetical protein